MKLPKQIYIPYVGALYDLAGKLFFIVNGVSFLMLSRNTFYNSDDSLLKDVFGSYEVFLIVSIIVGLLVMLAAHTCIVPSHNKYCQDQAVKDGRSVMYDKLCDMDDRLRRLEEKL